MSQPTRGSITAYKPFIPAYFARMNELHDSLAQRSTAYSRWHQSPYIFTHWIALVVLAASAGSVMLFSINAYAAESQQTIDAIVTPVKIPVDADLSSATTKFLRTLKTYQTAAAADKQAALATLLANARSRQKKMAMHVGDAPAEVEMSALPADFISQLPPEVASLMEQQTVVEAPITVRSIDYPDDRTETRFYLKTATGTVELHFKEKANGEEVPVHYQTGDIIKATGVQIGSDIALSAKDTALVKDPLPNTFGPQKLLIIPVNFQDLTQQPITPAGAKSLVFGSSTNQVNGFMQGASYGKTYFTGEVTPWVTVPVSSAGCPFNASDTYAPMIKALAQSAGYDTTQYSRFLFMFPGANCSWSGQSDTGTGNSWVESGTGGFSYPVIAHELGHNLGLYHSHSLTCGNAVTKINNIGCTFTEYGDGYDVMGASSSKGPYNAFQKELLGWLGTPGEPNITVATSSGPYFISTVTNQDQSPKALKILASALNNTYYYLEYRASDAVLVHFSQEGSGNGSELVRMGAPTNGGWPLAKGQVYTDTASGISFSIASTSPTIGASINVTMAPPDCVRAQPSIDIAPANQVGRVGAKLTYTALVTDNDSASCPATNYLIRASGYGSWPTTITPGSVLLSPGATTTAVLTTTSTADAADGPYDVYGVVIGANYDVMATSTYTVYTPPPDTTPPFVAFTYPGNGKTVSGSYVIVTATSTDNVKTTKVQFLADGKGFGTDTTSPFSMSWSLTSVAKGVHTITAVASDAAGNVATTSITVTK